MSNTRLRCTWPSTPEHTSSAPPAWRVFTHIIFYNPPPHRYLHTAFFSCADWNVIFLWFDNNNCATCWRRDNSECCVMHHKHTAQGRRAIIRSYEQGAAASPSETRREARGDYFWKCAWNGLKVLFLWIKIVSQIKRWGFIFDWFPTWGSRPQRGVTGGCEAMGFMGAIYILIYI